MPQILHIASHHLSWHSTCRQLCFFTCKISKLRVSLTGNHATSSLHSPFFSCYSTLISQFSLMLWTPKSTGSSRTVQIGDLIQITSQPGFSKNVRPYSSLQSPTLDKEELPIMIIIFQQQRARSVFNQVFLLVYFLLQSYSYCYLHSIGSVSKHSHES